MSMHFVSFIRPTALTTMLLLCLCAAACTGYLDGASIEKNYVLYPANHPVAQQRSRAFRVHASQQLEILKNSQTTEIRNLRKQLEKYRGLPEPEQLAEVNHAINHSIRYLPHNEHHPQPSGWGDIECVIDHGGDCADFTQAKYLALRYLGWPTERLQMVVGWSWHNQQKVLHALLLATQTNQSQLLLDNLDHMPKPPLDTTDFDPLYAYNEEQGFVFDTRGTTASTPGSNASEGKPGH